MNDLSPDLDLRAHRHGALGDPARLAIVDELTVSDRAPVELGELLDLPSNLLAHHLDVLEGVGLIERTRSSGDGRRRYVHLLTDALGDLAPRRPVEIGPALFVCTANSARSQLAAALWEDLAHLPASSAGTHPAPAVHPGAVAAAGRAGLDLSRATPHLLEDTDVGDGRPILVVTVCDRAHEELDGGGTLHWSIPDPAPDGDAATFDAVVIELRDRINAVLGLDASVA